MQRRRFELQRSGGFSIEIKRQTPSQMILERGLELIALLPSVGEAVPHPRLSGVRRLLLGRVRYYLYYHHVAESDTVDVLALWHSGRGAGPPP